MWQRDVPQVPHELFGDRGGEMTQASYPTYPARLLILGLILFGVAAGSAPGQQSSASLAKRGEKACSNQSPPTLDISSASVNTVNLLHEPLWRSGILRLLGQFQVPSTNSLQPGTVPRIKPVLRLTAEQLVADGGGLLQERILMKGQRFDA